MILKMDRLPIELPMPTNPSPNNAAAVQELLGGKFGEMSTLMNYTYQSFNMRGRNNKLRPFYDLIASIAGEEYGHIEVVSYTINLLLSGVTKRGIDPAVTGGRMPEAADARNTRHFIASGQTALPMDSHGDFWTGANVFNSGNLKLDLLHNFFLELGARANKMRVYDMVEDATAREMVGYLLVRGGVHAVAYAKAIEKYTGVEVTKLLPIPEMGNEKFPEAKKYMDQKMHLKLYSFSQDDYKMAGLIWDGTHPDDGQPVEFIQGAIPGHPVPELPEEPQLNAPGGEDFDPQMFIDLAKKMGIDYKY
jgi:Mn-containing catalase